MTYVHQLPAFRHPTTKSRAILSPVFGTNNFCVALFLYKKRDGRLVCDGHKSECMDWLKNNGFLKGEKQ
jgi:hypothetical protein